MVDVTYDDLAEILFDEEDPVQTDEIDEEAFEEMWEEHCGEETVFGVTGQDDEA